MVLFHHRVQKLANERVLLQMDPLMRPTISQRLLLKKCLSVNRLQMALLLPFQQPPHRGSPVLHLTQRLLRMKEAESFMVLANHLKKFSVGLKQCGLPAELLYNFLKQLGPNLLNRHRAWWKWTPQGQGRLGFVHQIHTQLREELIHWREPMPVLLVLLKLFKTLPWQKVYQPFLQEAKVRQMTGQEEYYNLQFNGLAN